MIPIYSNNGIHVVKLIPEKDFMLEFNERFKKYSISCRKDGERYLYKIERISGNEYLIMHHIDNDGYAVYDDNNILLNIMTEEEFNMFLTRSGSVKAFNIQKEDIINKPIVEKDVILFLIQKGSAYRNIYTKEYIMACPRCRIMDRSKDACEPSKLVLFTNGREIFVQKEEEFFNNHKS